MESRQNTCSCIFYGKHRPLAGATLEAPPHFEIDAAFEDGFGGFGGGGGAE
jgi:hypothetical protein